MNIKLSPRDELIVSIVAIVVIAVLLVVFLVMPKFRQQGEIIAKEAVIEQQLAEKRVTLARLKEAQKESVANRAELIRIATQMPDQPQLPTLIVEIQDVANQAGIDFVSVTPQQPEKTGEFSTIGLSLVTRGQFRDLVDFLSRVSELQRAVRVNGVTVGVEDYPTLSMSVDADTFVMTSGATTTGTVPPPPPGGGGG